MTALVLEFKKIGETKYRTFYLILTTEIIINESDIDDAFKLIYGTIISNIQKSLRKGSGWIDF